jgi:hypothetical protein
MMLGQLLRRLREAPEDEIAFGLAGDLVRFARVQAAATARGQSPGSYIHDAIRRFLDTASEEEWVAAMGLIHDDPTPGDRITDLAIERQLRRDEG